MKESKKRIIGFDLARGLAIIGMVFVNFKVVMVKESEEVLYQVLEMLSGKAAALFVVLAGVGMSLIYQSSKNKTNGVLRVKYTLLKRALFLFVVGMSYYLVWPADILHYYGLYILIGVFFLSLKNSYLHLTSLVLIMGYTILQFFLDYEKGWDFDTLTYIDFFSWNGFFRNMFINGFHPVIPWLAFLLIGIWLGRVDLSCGKNTTRISLMSLSVYFISQAFSIVSVNFFNSFNADGLGELAYFFTTEPMPPMFLYMISAAALAVFIISVSVKIGMVYPHVLIVKQLANTGQLALTNYFSHVVIGMLGLQLVSGKLELAYSIQFAFMYALVFNIFIVVFSHLWRKKFERGPIEVLMRKIAA